MSKLLRKYYNTKKKYRTDKMIEKYPDTLAWSKALNEELAKILEKMSATELSCVLEKTQGMFRIVIKNYLTQAQEREAHEKEGFHNELAVTFAG